MAISFSGFIERIKDEWQNAKEAIERKRIAQQTQEISIDVTDPLYPLANIIAQKKPCSLSQAMRHPLLNFIRSKQEKIGGEDQGKLDKIVDNFSNFLEQQDDPETTQAFLNYFASPAGLFLFRCSMLSTLFFSKFLNKEIDNTELLQKIFLAMSDPILSDKTLTDHDKILNDIIHDDETI